MTSRDRFEVYGHLEGLRGRCLTGWVVAVEAGTRRVLSGLRIGIYMDGVLVAEFVADQYRPDIGKELGTAHDCGFIFYPPVSALQARVSTFRVVALDYGRDVPGGPVEVSFLGHGQHEELRRLYVDVDELFVATWTIRSRLKRLLEETDSPIEAWHDWVRRYDEALLERCKSAARRRSPVPIALVCALHRPDPDRLAASIASVLGQVHDAWELHLVDDGGGDPRVEAVLEHHATRDPRITAMILPDRIGCAAAVNLALDHVEAAWIGFVGPGDLLSPAALAVMARVVADGGVRLAYSDEDVVDAVGHRFDPHLKGIFDRRHLLEDDCVGNFLVLARDLVETVGGLRSEHDAVVLHDLVLRASAHLRDGEVRHVPEILYSRGTQAASADADRMIAAARAAAVVDHLRSTGREAAVDPADTGRTCSVAFRLPQMPPAVSIFVPYRDQIVMTRDCVEAVLEKTDYPNFEIVLVDNWSTSAEARDFRESFTPADPVRFVDVRERFNYSRINNLAAATSMATHFVFMNNDVVVEGADWLTQFVAEVEAAEDVGIVGAMLLYPGGLIQHAGVALGIGGCADHVGRGFPGEHPGHRGRHRVVREQSAVTAALMMCRACVFRTIDGFDGEHLGVAFNDVDLCLKARRAGYRVLWTPRVRAVHRESLSRPNDLLASQSGRFFSEIATMRERWGPELDADPFYNVHFSRSTMPYRFLGPSRPGSV